MTEIPEHLRKRAEAARLKAEADANAGAPAAASAAAPDAPADPRIPSAEGGEKHADPDRQADRSDHRGQRAEAQASHAASL